MGTYAHVQDGAVLNIIVADEAHISERPTPTVGEWIAVPDGQSVFIGGSYDKEANTFSEPTYWEPPPKPDDGKNYEWDHVYNVWKEVT